LSKSLTRHLRKPSSSDRRNVRGAPIWVVSAHRSGFLPSWEKDQRRLRQRFWSGSGSARPSPGAARRDQPFPSSAVLSSLFHLGQGLLTDCLQVLTRESGFLPLQAFEQESFELLFGFAFLIGTDQFPDIFVHAAIAALASSLLALSKLPL
jgi:hypothetical protein